MQKKLNWKAYSGGDRNAVIRLVKDVIIQNDASILNFTMFSDIAINLSLEVPVQRVSGLHQALSEIMTLSGSVMEEVSKNSLKEILIFMSINFSEGKGEVIHEIPNVPG